MNKNVALFIATFGGIGGYVGGGTITSFLLLPFFYLPLSINIAILACLFVLAYLTTSTACSHYRNDDPRQIVIDEAIGALFLLICLQYSWQLTIYQALIAFMLFRIFDISKIGGLKYVEMLPGATGVIFDDVAAAVYAYFIMYLFI